MYSTTIITINHQALLDTLSHYGVRGVALKWFKHYLKNRNQYVKYTNCRTQTEEIVCGVQQGPVLCPLRLYYTQMIPPCR